MEWSGGRLCFERTFPLANDRARLSPDGRYLSVIEGAYGMEESRLVRIIDIDSGEDVAWLENTGSVSSTAWHPDSQTLSVGIADSNDIVTWNVATEESIQVNTSQRGGEPKLCVNSRGDLLSSFSSWALLLDVYRPASGKLLLHVPRELNVAWSSQHDDKMLGEVHGSNGGWHYEVVESSPVLKILERNPALGPVQAWRDISIHGDDRLIAVGSDSGVSLFDLETGLDVGHLSVGNALHPCFVPQTGELLTYSQYGLLRWPVKQTAGDKAHWTIGPPQRLTCPPCSGTQVASDRTGRTIAVAAMDAAYVLHDSGRRVVKLDTAPDCRKIAVSPDGRWIVTATHHFSRVDVWSAETGERLHCLREPEAAIALGPRFSDDGSLLTVRDAGLFETRDWQEKSWTTQAGAAIGAVSPDNQLLVDLTRTGAVLRDVLSGRVLCRLDVPDSVTFWFAAFTRDGKRLVLSSNDQHATYIWDLPRLNQELSAIGLGWTEIEDLPPSEIAQPHPGE